MMAEPVVRRPSTPSDGKRLEHAFWSLVLRAVDACTRPIPRQVILLFSARQPDETHLLVIQAPMERPAGTDVKRAVEAWMVEMTAMIEHRIRQDPTQWLWIHDRWRRQPEEDLR